MEFVADLKSRVDIVPVIGEYVRLRRAGASERYSGLCPFHKEKTPSFSVHGKHQFYKCFGCGVHGDVITFVMEIERLPFWDAVKYLAERNGIPMPKRADTGDAESRLRGRLLEMHEVASAAFQEHLRSGAGQDARAYLHKRGVTPEIAGEFLLGFSDRSGQMLTRMLQQRGFTPDELEASGLALRRQDGSGMFDRFRGRLMFPIQAENGSVIAFGGRAVYEGDEPKYLNSSETPIYRKSHVLYNLNRARRAAQDEKFTILVEGYMDVIGVWSAGVSNVVATCGTALTTFQVQALRRHAPRVVLNFDSDAAGSGAAERYIPVLLEEGVQLQVLTLPSGKDPDDFVKANGAQAYKDAVAKARSYFHWLADRLRGKTDIRRPENQRPFLEQLLESVNLIPNPIDRVAVADDVAAYSGIDRGLVLDEFRKAASKRRESSHQAAPVTKDPSEVLLLQAMLSNPEAREEVAPVLRQLEILDQFRSAGIFRTLLKLMETGEEIDFDGLAARLGEADRDLLMSLLCADEESDKAVSTEQAVACVRSLATRQTRLQVRDLDQKIRTAEREGNVAEAMRLLGEREAIVRHRGAGGG